MSPIRRSAASARRALLALTVLAAACAPAIVASPPREPTRTTGRYDVRPARTAFADTRAGAPAPSGASPATSLTNSATPLFSAATAAAERAGVWSGTRTGGARGGSLELRLREDAPGAVAGELVLGVTPRASTFAERPGRAAGPARVTVPLVRGRHEGGWLVLDTDAYYDAGCECTVTGTYQGVARGDSLTGTYVTRGPATAAEVRGRWRAARRPATP